MKRPAMKRHTLLILTCLVLPGCTLWRSGGVPPPPITLPTPPRDLDSIPDAVPRAEPRSRYGNPESYVVFGQTYRLQKSARGHVERGLASWYGPGFHAERTSSGEPYDMYAMTAAHKTLPIPAYVRVTHLENGRSVVVKVNDRGPFVGDRIIDLSYTAAHKLGMLRSGTAPVEIRVLEPGEATPTPSLTASSTPSIGVTHYVQAGAFGARVNAEAMLTRLRSAGIDNVLIREVTIAGRQWFRVQAGPVDQASAVDALVERLRRAGVPDARPAHE